MPRPKPPEELRTRTYRCPDTLYQEAMEAADRRGEALSDVIRGNLESYVAASKRRRARAARGRS